MLKSLTENVSPLFIVPDQFYDLNGLIYSSIFLFFSSYLFSLLLFKSNYISFLVSSLKSLIFLFYFLVYFNSTNFNFIDSITYIENSVFLSKNYTFFELLLNHNQLVAPLSGGHSFYYLWSILAINILGPYYFSPIVFNILSLFLGGYYLQNIVKKFSVNFSTRFFSFFYLFHWEIVPWSSFFNLRDIIIQVSILSVSYYIICFINKSTIRNLIFLLISLFILSYLRVHVSYILSLLVFFWVVYTSRFLLIKSIFILFLGSFFLFNSNLYNMLSLFLDDFNFRVLSFLFSPIPSISTLYNGYGFLIFASILNIAFFPFVLTGYIYLYKKSGYEFLIFSSIFILLLLIFSSYANIQGPRQRLMVTPFYFTFMYFGIKIFISKCFPKPSS